VQARIRRFARDAPRSGTYNPQHVHSITAHFANRTFDKWSA
jgi:hypothetical protein